LLAGSLLWGRDEFKNTLPLSNEKTIPLHHFYFFFSATIIFAEPADETVR
jgi:hypothetical protein